MIKPEYVAVVVWDDAHGSTATFEATEVDHHPYRFTSVGLLIQSDAMGVSLAREVGYDGRYRDHEFIPRAMVHDEWMMGELRKPKARKVKEKVDATV